MNTTSEGSWASRNWKWALPSGCLLVVVLIVAFVGAIMAFVFSMMKSNDAYQHSLETARNHPQVIERLGQPIEASWFVLGSVEESGGAGQAQFTTPISGPKGAGTLYVEARKSAGQWNYAVMAVEFEGSAGRVDLLAMPAPSPALPPPAQ